uniref:NADH-ubiquinone oxidoreductase chain 5 n=1 Tax=Quadristernoseta cf. intermedia XFX-2019 TaxID=2695871 RepID=A0A6B9WGN6_9ACAR|nr:NADH dehydrogenase subunit 5 [Quadristernoseta cf. intermedia XFX-2019]
MFKMWSMILLVLGIFMFLMGVYMVMSGFKFVMEFLILKILGMELKIYFYFDWMSCSFVGVVLFISSMVLWYSYCYMGLDPLSEKFCYMVLLFVMSMILMILGGNMLMILLGWDGLGLVSYLLVIYYQNVNSNSAGMITVLTNRIGDVGMLLGLVLFLNMMSWDFYVMEMGGNYSFILMVFVVFGALTKSAQMPFSAWLPAAMAAPTPVSALVHSSTLVTAGVYLIIRFSYYFNGGVFSSSLLYISVMTTIMSGFGASFEMDFKKVIALSTLSQLGVMMMILSFGFYELAYYHLVIHAIFKAMLFLCAGVIIHGSFDFQDFRYVGMYYYMSPYISGMIGLGNLALAGFPFMSGFYSKDLILEVVYGFNMNIFLFICILLSVICTVLYSLRMMYYIIWMSVLKFHSYSYIEDSDMNYPIMIMGIMVVILGSVYSWIFMLYPMFINLMLWLKLVNLFMVLMGLWFFYNFFFLYSGGVFSDYMNFYGGMWYMPIISSGMFMKMFNYMDFFVKNVEQGWYEEMGAQGIYYNFDELSSNFIHFQGVSLQYYLFFMVVFLFIFIL